MLTTQSGSTNAPPMIPVTFRLVPWPTFEAEAPDQGDDTGEGSVKNPPSRPPVTARPDNLISPPA